MLERLLEILAAGSDVSFSMLDDDARIRATIYEQRGTPSAYKGIGFGNTLDEAINDAAEDMNDA